MNHYFLTGATGNIGSALVPLLLQNEGIFHLLIRADNEAHLEQRFLDLCRFWDIGSSVARARMIPCRGDMTVPRFGLDAGQYAAISGECSHIIHCGGVVRMNLPIEEARKSAAGVARQIVRLGETLQEKGCLKKIDFVSTVGVIGKSAKTLTEELVTEPRAFHNTYEQAKAEAEEYLHPFMAEGRLPITIHRPSMVVGDSKTGRVKSFQVFYHLCEFLSGKKTFGLLPRLDGAKLDIIPVDYVARVIAWSVHSNTTAGTFIHECAGKEDALQVTELEKRLQDYAYFKKGTSRPCGRNVYIPLAQFNSAVRLLSLFLPKREKKVLRTLPHFLDYLHDPQEFSDRITTRRLSEKIVKPKIDGALPEIIDYYIKRICR